MDTGRTPDFTRTRRDSPTYQPALWVATPPEYRSAEGRGRSTEPRPRLPSPARYRGRCSCVSGSLVTSLGSGDDDSFLVFFFLLREPCLANVAALIACALSIIFKSVKALGLLLAINFHYQLVANRAIRSPAERVHRFSSTYIMGMRAPARAKERNLESWGLALRE